MAWTSRAQYCHSHGNTMWCWHYSFISKVTCSNERFILNRISLAKIYICNSPVCMIIKLQLLSSASCEGYVFTRVCHSVPRGVVSKHALQVVSQHALQQGDVLSQHALQQGGGVCSRGVCSGGGCLLPVGVCRDPPRKQTATVADGTHPTGMHSCFRIIPKAVGTLWQVKQMHATSGLILYILVSTSLVLGMFSTWFTKNVTGTSWYMCIACPIILVLVAMQQITSHYLPKRRVVSDRKGGK